MPRQSIIFLPGFMCDGRLFQAQKTALSRQGTLCIDGDITRSASIQGIAEDVLADAPETFALAGLSMGGIVALEIMRQSPHRVSHLALLNTTANTDKVQAQRKKQLCRVAEGELDLVMREELKPSYLSAENRTEERLGLLAEMALRLGEEVFTRQSIALMHRQAAHDLLPDIQCPTLVLTGQQDIVCTPQIHVELADAIPQASLTILAHCGHLSAMEQPGAVLQAIQILMKRSSRLNPDFKVKQPNVRLVRNS